MVLKRSPSFRICPSCVRIVGKKKPEPDLLFLIPSLDEFNRISIWFIDSRCEISKFSQRGPAYSLPVSTFFVPYFSLMMQYVEAIDGPEEAYIDQGKTCQDDYRIWKNVPSLAPTISPLHPATMAFLSVQFFLDPRETSLSVGSQELLIPKPWRKDFSWELCLGNTPSPFHLPPSLLHESLKPCQHWPINYHADKQSLVTSASSKKISTVQKINHPGDVKSSSVILSQNPDVILCCVIIFAVSLVYDLPGTPTWRAGIGRQTSVSPQLRLVSNY